MIELDTVFRSIIYIKTEEGKETISQKDCIKNFRSLQQIVPEAPEEKAYKIIYYFILDYIKKCDTETLEVPSYEFIKNHFETVEGSETALITLEKIRMQQPYVGMDYRRILQEYNEYQKVLELSRVLDNTHKIASVGMDIGKGKNKTRIKGITDSINYFARETRDLHQKIIGIKTEGQIVSAVESKEVKEEYARAESNPTESIGIYTWLREIDDVINGLKNGELMMIAAFAGHCKTTFSLNMAYKAIFGGWNTCFVTLEMSYIEIRRKLYVLHSCNPMFQNKWPESAHLVGKITYNNVLYGKLNLEEKEYFFRICEDFDLKEKDETSGYGKLFIWQPEKTITTLSDIDLKLRQYQQELKIQGRDLEFAIIDYISLMGADESERARDGNETVNNIIKNLKRTCLTFNNGKGIRILSPHQINRTSYLEAKKNEGLYNLTALSNNHEAERSCDIVVSSYKFDDEGDGNRLKICCLKARRNKFFKPFDACINFESGFIWNFTHQIEQDNQNFIDLSAVV